jgi:hypothetical protein
VIGSCPYCGALLGPAESALGCISCRGRRDGSNQDDIIAVLERSDIPLPHWDIKRLIDRERRYPIHNGSLLVWVSQDRRACWGGRGTYGLYRHGVLPGVRDLGAAATVFLYTTDLALDYSQVWFILKHAGYRSEEASIYYALRRAESQGLVTRTWGGSWRRPTREALPEARVKRLLGVVGQDFETVIERTTAQVEGALAERRRRLYG